ncbi:MAG: hypothetical protein PF450_16660 [Bacteroidales bacterium]|jgi:hypothetical protein|nr:hypothetical protein [Bacteroidales bacterium]
MNRNKVELKEAIGRVKKLFFFFLIVLITACNTTKKPEVVEEQWVQLFNGENLEGWNIKIAGYDLNDNFGNTFRVEDG